MLGVFDPGELGDSHNEYDAAFVETGSARGIPPQIVKGLVIQEGGFHPLEWRYEPLSPTTGDRYIQKAIATGTAPYAHYALRTASSPAGDLLLDLNPGGSSYTVDDDISPRKSLSLPRGSSGVEIAIRPVDVCPNLCVTAREIFENNDDHENWSDSKFVGATDWWDADHLKALEFVAQTPASASYGLMQTMFVRAVELKWATTTGAQNPSYLMDTPANWAIGGGSIAVGSLELYTAYRACRKGDWASDPNFVSSQAYEDLIVDALNWYNHGNDATRNPDYGANAWNYSLSCLPEHSASKIFP